MRFKIQMSKSTPWDERRYRARWQARYRAERLDGGHWRRPITVLDLELSEIADTDLPSDLLGGE